MKITNAMLRNTRDAVMASMSPSYRPEARRIESAAVAIIENVDIGTLVQTALNTGNDLTAIVPDGVANVLAQVYNIDTAQMTASERPEFYKGFISALPAVAVAVMCRTLDAATSKGDGRVTEQFVARCSQMTLDASLEKFGVTKRLVADVIAAASLGIRASEHTQ